MPLCVGECVRNDVKLLGPLNYIYKLSYRTITSKCKWDIMRRERGNLMITILLIKCNCIGKYGNAFSIGENDASNSKEHIKKYFKKNICTESC